MSCNNNIIDLRGAKQNWALRTDQTWGATLTFTDKETGDPIDLSIYTDIILQIRKKRDTAVLFQYGFSSNKITVTGDDDNVLNILDVVIPSTPGNYVYDIDFVKSGGGIDQFIYGDLLISA
jgi:hypothetical protein